MLLLNLSMAYKNTEDYTRDQKDVKYIGTHGRKVRAKQGYLDWKKGKTGLPGELYYQRLNNSTQVAKLIIILTKVDEFLDLWRKVLEFMADFVDSIKLRR